MTNAEMFEAKSKQYFKPLTGFRAMAAFMVYLCHFNPVPIVIPFLSLKNFFLSFNTGVTLFFVLSGFLITYRYFDTNELSASYFKKYFINRFARIYPLYFIITTINFIYVLRYPNYGAAPEVNIYLKYILNITFVRGFSEVLRYSLAGQGWTLTVEETFYIIAPFLTYIFAKHCKTKLQTVLFCVAIIFVNYSIGILSIKIFGINKLGFFSNIHFVFDGTFFGRCFEFIIGSLLAVCVKRRWLDILNNRINTYIFLFLIFITIYVISLVKYNIDLPEFYSLILINIILPLFVAGFIYNVISNITLVSRMLSNRFVDLLGKSSYAFYLIHIGIFYSEIKLRIIKYEPYNYIIVFSILVIFSILLYKYIEEPINLKVRNYFRNG